MSTSTSSSTLTAIKKKMGESVFNKQTSKQWHSNGHPSPHTSADFSFSFLSSLSFLLFSSLFFFFLLLLFLSLRGIEAQGQLQSCIFGEKGSWGPRCRWWDTPERCTCPQCPPNSQSSPFHSQTWAPPTYCCHASAHLHVCNRNTKSKRRRLGAHTQREREENAKEIKGRMCSNHQKWADSRRSLHGGAWSQCRDHWMMTSLQVYRRWPPQSFQVLHHCDPSPQQLREGKSWRWNESESGSWV